MLAGDAEWAKITGGLPEPGGCSPASGDSDDFCGYSLKLGRERDTMPVGGSHHYVDGCNQLGQQ
jgi:hypothetical protein